MTCISVVFSEYPKNMQYKLPHIFIYVIYHQYMYTLSYVYITKLLVILIGILKKFEIMIFNKI